MKQLFGPLLGPLSTRSSRGKEGGIDAAPAKSPVASTIPVPCFHCGTPSRDPVRAHEKTFCCHGCLTVFQLLTENGLDNFYSLGPQSGTRANGPRPAEAFAYLDEPEVRRRIVDFSDERTTRVTFHLPAIHCIACVWLLENLFRLHDGIGRCQVNFPRKQASITFEDARITLSQVTGLLTSIGYEPELTLSSLDAPRPSRTPARLWLQVGVAGFAFGNSMLFSLASYFGLDRAQDPIFHRVFGGLSFLLALPVVFYSASDYWRSAWVSLRQRALSIDVPIAAGILALFFQSAAEVLSGRGEGYFDSLSGLLFFLLCGKLFQQKTYQRLAFDRDYKAFFPLSVTRQGAGGEERISLAQLNVGDRLWIRNGEVLPADSRLLDGPALLDYSFVTGESEAVNKNRGDHLYAGGRQIGGAIAVETVKPVSQSYLASLWSQDAFRKNKAEAIETLTNRYSRRFTWIVLSISLAAAAYWSFSDWPRALVAFASVLIVACPCALALAAPFTLGTALRVLGRQGIFLKNASVIETLAETTTVVFDKTGTLTCATAGPPVFRGDPLESNEIRWITSLSRQSPHPYAASLASLDVSQNPPEPVMDFVETPGLGMRGIIGGHLILMGSDKWLEAAGVQIEPVRGGPPGSTVHVAMDGRLRGTFVLSHELRPETEELLRDLSADHDIALLSGDNDKERARFERLFGLGRSVHFSQSPLDKLEFIRRLQAQGRKVMMVGDGLNDAGALQQSDAGVAVVEDISSFSPASDVIVAAAVVPRLTEALRYCRACVRVVRASFLISGLYNAVGIAIAAQGLLSPVICAILMPLSSITVVAFASGMASALGWRCFDRERIRFQIFPGTVHPDESAGFIPSTASEAIV